MSPLFFGTVNHFYAEKVPFRTLVANYVPWNQARDWLCPDTILMCLVLERRPVGVVKAPLRPLHNGELSAGEHNHKNFLPWVITNDFGPEFSSAMK